LIIRESRDKDLNALLEVEKQAFGDDEGPEIVELVKALFDDPTAKPLLSLIALDEQRVIGHIMFAKYLIPFQRNLPVHGWFKSLSRV